MNANPFTKGHQYLVEKAAQESPHVYVFVLSEDKSLFSKSTFRNGAKGVAHLQCDSPIYRRLLSFVCDFSYLFLKEKAPLEVAAIQQRLMQRY